MTMFCVVLIFKMRTCFCCLSGTVHVMHGCYLQTSKLVLFSFYVLLVEDGNGQSKVAATFLLLHETKAAISRVIEIIKRHNPSWKFRSVSVLMTDKRKTCLLKTFHLPSSRSLFVGKLLWIRWG